MSQGLVSVEFIACGASPPKQLPGLNGRMAYRWFDENTLPVLGGVLRDGVYYVNQPPIRGLRSKI